MLVAAGAGAGIATTFNAPIGGLMFAQEIVLLGHTEIANLTLLIIATFTAVITSRAILGNAVVFVAPEFVLRSYWEMATYALMGAALGALAAGYIRFFNATEAWFRRLDLPVWVKLEAGLAVVGVIAIWLPQNLSDGYPVINSAMAGEFGIGMLAAMTCAKIFASSVSLGCGAPGGSFGPTFFIGTMAGGLFQRVSAMVIPHLTGPRGSYALVGLGAFLAGTTHAPLTALFLLWEMTHSDTIALPSMIATITALVVARAIETESIDEFRLARAGKKLQIGRDRLALTLIPVSAVVTKNVTIVSENTSLSEVLRTAGETAQSTLPVVDSDGIFVGTIVVRDLLSMLSGGQELGPLVNAFDICNTHGPTVPLDANLDEASQLMEHEGLDEIPVVERITQRFLGLVTGRHIAQALNRVSVSLSTLATRDPNIYWATGYRVTRISVPANAAGKTVRQLDPRARFSVTVLAVQDANNRDGGFAPITPDRPLKEGDELIAAGRPQDIRQFTTRAGERGSRGRGASLSSGERIGKDVGARSSGADFRAHLLDRVDVALELRRDGHEPFCRREMSVAAADRGQPQLERRVLRAPILLDRILPVKRLNRANRRAMPAQQGVEARPVAGVAKRMRRDRDAALVMNHFDQAVALEHPRRQVESAQSLRR